MKQTFSKFLGQSKPGFVETLEVTCEDFSVFAAGMRSAHTSRRAATIERPSRGVAPKASAKPSATLRSATTVKVSRMASAVLEKPKRNASQSARAASVLAGARPKASAVRSKSAPTKTLKKK